MDDTQDASASTVAASSAPQGTASEPLEVVSADRYTDRKELSRGGMGRIVTAHDRRLGRIVAIKEVRGDAGEMSARFQREIRLSARLEHPAIVTIHDAGIWPSGEPFYVMRLVPGRSLADALQRAASLTARLAYVPNALAVADALAYAHGKRIIHRDLKPHNVMLGDFGETVVIDWGLAKDLGVAPARPSTTDLGAAPEGTELGAVLGTPTYMPPSKRQGQTPTSAPTFTRSAPSSTS
jgi:serine/threonine protein kinase